MPPIRNCNTGSGLEPTAAISPVASHILTAAIADALSSNLTLFLLKRQREGHPDAYQIRHQVRRISATSARIIQRIAAPRAFQRKISTIASGY
jgi:hypothetical protein